MNRFVEYALKIGLSSATIVGGGVLAIYNASGVPDAIGSFINNSYAESTPYLSEDEKTNARIALLGHLAGDALIGLGIVGLAKTNLAEPHEHHKDS